MAWHSPPQPPATLSPFERGEKVGGVLQAGQNLNLIVSADGQKIGPRTGDGGGVIHRRPGDTSFGPWAEARKMRSIFLECRARTQRL